MDARFEIAKRIQRCQDLDRAHGVQHVCVMAGRCAEAAAVVQAGQHEFDDVGSWQGVGMAQEVESG